MTQLRTKIHALGMALALTVVTEGVPVHAQGVPGYPDTVEGYDPREVGMLPGYCIYTQVFRDRVAAGNNRQIIEQ